MNKRADAFLAFSTAETCNVTYTSKNYVFDCCAFCFQALVSGAVSAMHEEDQKFELQFKDRNPQRQIFVSNTPITAQVRPVHAVSDNFLSKYVLVMHHAAELC